MNESITPEFAQFLAWEAISRDVVTVKTIYIDMADGDHAAGIFLSQLVYWYLKPDKSGRRKTRVFRDGRWWVAKSRDDWYEEIRLKPRQYDRVSKKLIELGIIETATYKFGGRPIAHVRIVIRKFMEAWKQLAQVDLSELPDGVKSTSPNGEVHIQRVTQDQVLNSGELSTEDLNVIEEEKEKDDTEPPCDDCCEVCGRTDKYAKKLPVDVDPKERCAWCFVLDGWAYIMDGKKPVPKRTGTNASEKLRKKAHTRVQEEEFRSVWVFALERASRTKHLMTEKWFHIEFFLRNDEKYASVADGTWDWKNKQDYPQDHSQLLAWLAHKRAGLAGEPQAAGWSQFGVA
jgi:hypothetical protein